MNKDWSAIESNYFELDAIGGVLSVYFFLIEIVNAQIVQKNDNIAVLFV